jgi:predicted NACHT family NTPase
LKALIFSTPRKVTETTKEKWAATIRRNYSIELIVVSREDIITDLMRPDNASICGSMLGISIAHKPALHEVTEKTRAAASEVIIAWLNSARLAGKPKIELIGVRIDSNGGDTSELITISDLKVALFESQRIIIEGAAGAGKTTTLIQLASSADRQDRGDVKFLIDLPELLRSATTCSIL